MKKLIVIIPALCILFTSCTKNVAPVNDQCIVQKDNTFSNSYFYDDVVSINYTGNHCGLMPLSINSYWVYEDSLFDNNGIFINRKSDTLRYTKTLQSPDNLIWWETNKDVGLPLQMYSSNSAVYSLQRGVFIPDSLYSKREFYDIEKDSVIYLSGFSDIVAFGKIARRSGVMKTPLGNFYNYIFYEKYSPYYRRDRVYFVPGIGVIKYTNEYYKAPGSPDNFKAKKISTLVGYFAE